MKILGKCKLKEKRNKNKAKFSNRIKRLSINGSGKTRKIPPLSAYALLQSDCGAALRFACYPLRLQPVFTYASLQLRRTLLRPNGFVRLTGVSHPKPVRAKGGGVCLKKLEPISSRTPDFARAERVVA